MTLVKSFIWTVITMVTVHKYTLNSTVVSFLKNTSHENTLTEDSFYLYSFISLYKFSFKLFTNTYKNYQCYTH